MLTVSLGTLIQAISVCDLPITVFEAYVQISNTTFNVTIAPNIGPDEGHYASELSSTKQMDHITAAISLLIL
jgi:hypothetical protein